MLELTLRCEADQLVLALGDSTARVAWAAVAFSEAAQGALRQDAAVYGRCLFETAFSGETLRTALREARPGTRLLLVTEDPSIAEIPREYLRDGETLLAGRLNLVRGLPENRRLDARPFAGTLEMLGIPVSPIDEPRVLNTETEWTHLVSAVTAAGKALKLTRVRPPTIGAVERALDPARALSSFTLWGTAAAPTGKACWSSRMSVDAAG
jgi:hypothetical protein